MKAASDQPACFIRFIADGNGTSIFTQSGATARKFEKGVDAGQIGTYNGATHDLRFTRD